ncbi:MAG TPA: DUF2202 domain-containing protein [Candidatus Saccharibacteria bacterium]|mgnify:CR=1 FL=1|nr:DUF2202 domain-containing protein [Candidatus Saccharibacteria bacterium]
MKKVNSKILTVASIGVLALVGVGGYFALNNNSEKDQVPTAASSAGTNQNPATGAQTTPTVAARSTEEQLLYLIEEEKLAHDVYSVMYQKYGANVFGNILQSESTHQGRILTLLQARNITDPRSNEIGVFKDKDLQTLYNQLIEQGNKNASEAYRAGVAIEEKDIADISAQLATATDQDVIAALESLRSGSENHLRAFNRQL